MINYKELRIGNIVNVSGKPETVTGVLQFGCYFHLLYYPFNLSQIEPIELTEEWLLKFGFEEIKWYFQKITEADSVEFDLSYDGDYKLWFLSNIHFIDAGIKFVHQLQNLYFSLTGEELTIK